ncbi:hypothetical protein AMATHDRAFT_7642 [Amanita thiersii Skay4041]|uniref:Fungal-type protein kinase domain-containing protein n=1 Tax=Amanita thiersii Skay4041 TaxID=703135 RepID=A0A2A9NB81_9AGAR|nr:hypothetical protein AMATHDRAFT_7642 [Amanita thiersii Skay4041]
MTDNPNFTIRTYPYLVETPKKAGPTKTREVEMEAKEIRKSCKAELRSVLLCAKDDFVDHLLRPPKEEASSWDSIFEEVTRSHYSRSKHRWKSFPTLTKNTKERQYYQPFVKLANDVNKRCESTQTKQDALKGVWMDTHSISPQERGDSKSRIQPDIVHVASAEHFKKATKDIYQTHNDHDKKIAKKKLTSSLKFWWQQIHVLVEIKRKQPSKKKLQKHILQLCCYMRQMFQEQLDRRFIISLLLCGDELFLWLLDRTGLIGTQVSINIHEEPKMFIRVLTAISLLPAHKLGWDSTMKLYVDGQIIPSYRLPADKREKSESDLFRDNWVISMPTDDGGREDFLTIQLIDALGAQMLCSRSTVVWEVIKLSDLPQFVNGNMGSDGTGETDTNGPEIYVLKQAWQQVEDGCEPTVPEELTRYEEAKLKKNFIHSAECVRIDGKLSFTSRERKLLRPEDLDAPQPNAGSMSLRDEHNDPFRVMDLLRDALRFFKLSGNVVGRVQTRVVMKGSGYPLTYASSCLEIATVLRDCIKMHKKMYMNGVLHRDVSLGNIIIMSNGKGRLIDLDRAKYVSSQKQVLQPVSAVTMDEMEALGRNLKRLGLNPDEDIRRLSLQYFQEGAPISAYYLNGLIHNFFDDKTVSLRLKDLGWPDEKQREEYMLLPDFTKYRARDAFYQTGTIPFMSHQALSGSTERKNEPFIHDAYHDMESFFWVLVYVCVTTQGPLGGRRPEMDGNKKFANQVTDMFHQEMQYLGKTRKDYIHLEDAFKSLLSCLHPSFHDLQPLIEKWRDILSFTSSNKGLDRDIIHHHMLRVLKKTISELKRKNPVETDEIAKKNRAVREKHWTDRRRIPCYRAPPLGGSTGQQLSADRSLNTPPKSRGARRRLSTASPLPKAKRRKTRQNI